MQAVRGSIQFGRVRTESAPPARLSNQAALLVSAALAHLISMELSRNASCRSPVRLRPRRVSSRLVSVRVRAARRSRRRPRRGGCRSTRRSTSRSSRTSASSIERLNPQIQDLAIAQARSCWAPTFTSTLPQQLDRTIRRRTRSPGGQTKITDSRFDDAARRHPAAADRRATTRSAGTARGSPRPTSSTPSTRSSARRLRSTSRSRCCATSRSTTSASSSTISREDPRERPTCSCSRRSSQTTRNVRNAYWDLAYHDRQPERAAQQSLDLAKRLLADNEKRVQIGTMAPIDIVEAQSEVARNEESVIVAEAAIKQAEDRLRALIFDPAAPDFWTHHDRAERRRAVPGPGDRRRRRRAPRARQPHRSPSRRRTAWSRTTSASATSGTRLCPTSTRSVDLQRHAAPAASRCQPDHRPRRSDGRPTAHGPRRSAASASVLGDVFAQRVPDVDRSA